MPKARASHQTLFTFRIYSGAERALNLDTVTWTNYSKPPEHLAQWPEIQALLYHLGKSKYTFGKETSALGLKDVEIPCVTTLQVTVPQQLDTCVTSQESRAPASPAQNIPTPADTSLKSQ